MCADVFNWPPSITGGLSYPEAINILNGVGKRRASEEKKVSPPTVDQYQASRDKYKHHVC